MKKPLRVADILFELWNKNHIIYCHWKSNEHLFQGLIGDTDFDMLVDLSMKEQAEVCLREAGYSRFKFQYGSRYDLVDDWSACDDETGKMIHIHLHYKLITGHKGLKEYDLPWTEEMLSSRVLHDEFPVWVIDPNLEIVKKLKFYTKNIVTIDTAQDFNKELLMIHNDIWKFISQKT